MTATAYYQPKRHSFSIVARSIPEGPARWGLMLGDVAHAYHGVLDHLAWQLVKRGRLWASLTDDQKGRVYFPITNSARHFRKVKDGKLPGVRRADIAIVRRYQPYQRGKTNLPRHVLTLLNALSNADKHRNVQPVIALPTEATWELEVRDFEVTRWPTRAKRKPVHVGAELARVFGRKTGPHPYAKVKGTLAAEPALNETTWLHDWLTETRAFTMGLLGEFSDPPSDLLLNILG